MEHVFKALAEEAGQIVTKLKEDVASLRTGRATPAMLENIPVDSYGTTLPLKQVAALNVNPPNIIIVQPWDKSILQQIEQAVRNYGAGFSATAEGDIVRVTLPPLTEERRKELQKLLAKKQEEAKIAFRLARDEARKKIQELLDSKQIREDDKFRGNERLQKETDKFNKTLEELVEQKEKEILSV